MKNVTISLDETLAAKARVEAARQGKSLSRFVADMLASRCGGESSQEEAFAGFMSGSPWRSKGGYLLTRADQERLAELAEEAARRGTPLPDLIADVLAAREAKPAMTAMERFLSGPALSLLNEDGTAPTRDQIYDRDPS